MFSPPTRPSAALFAALLAAVATWFTGCDLLTATLPVTLTVTKAGEGTVTSWPEGIRLEGADSVASADFQLDSKVTLTPAAVAGGGPGRWGGACEGVDDGAQCSLQIRGQTLVTVDFEEETTAPPANDCPGMTAPSSVAVSLEPGEAHRLEADETRIALDCGVYVLAVYDGRYLRVEAEPPPYVKTDSFSVTVAAASATTVSRSMAASPPPIGAPHPEAHLEDPALDHGGHWSAETETWEPGDTIADYTSSLTPEGVVVRAVIDNFYVVADPVGEPVTRAVLDSMVATVQSFEQWHRPWLEGLFGATPGTPNGQLLTVMIPIGDAVGAAGSANNIRVHIHVGTRSWEYEGVVYRVLVHEYSHAYDRARNRVIRERDGAEPHREIWNAEGLAEHVAYRAAAERFGWPLHADAPPDYRLWAVVAGWGELENGYGAAGGYLWYLADRLAEARQWSWGTAHDSVTLAAAGNRWGCHWENGAPECHRHDGVYDLMARSLGGGWDPAGAVLTYALLQAVDGWTPNPDLQNPHVRHNEASRLKPVGSIHSSSGDGVSATLQAGSYAVFELVAEEAAEFTFSGSDPDLHWMVVRVR